MMNPVIGLDMAKGEGQVQSWIKSNRTKRALK